MLRVQPDWLKKKNHRLKNNGFVNLEMEYTGMENALCDWAAKMKKIFFLRKIYLEKC